MSVQAVAEIVADVRARGGAAVREWSLRLDGVEPSRAEPEGEVPRDALLALADAVERWHAVQRPADVRLEVAPGVELERRWVPLGSVGIYVPRGLLSTLVMCAVPARLGSTPSSRRLHSRTAAPPRARTSATIPATPWTLMRASARPA